MFFFSPLEQFEIIILQPIRIGYDFSITNATISLIIAFLFFLGFFFLGFCAARVVPTPLQTICESLYLFIITIIKQQAGFKGLRYFPLFFVIFFLIIFSNLFVLVPFVFTPTSHLCLFL